MLTIGKSELRIFTKEVKFKDKNGKSKTRFIFNACVGSTKNEDGEYLNWYVPVNFSTKVQEELPKLKDGESFDIIVRDAWFKAYKDKDDRTCGILFVNKATIVDADEEDEDEKPKSKKASKKPKSDDDEDDE